MPTYPLCNIHPMTFFAVCVCFIYNMSNKKTVPKGQLHNKLQCSRTQLTKQKEILLGSCRQIGVLPPNPLGIAVKFPYNSWGLGLRGGQRLDHHRSLSRFHQEKLLRTHRSFTKEVGLSFITGTCQSFFITTKEVGLSFITEGVELAFVAFCFCY